MVERVPPNRDEHDEQDHSGFFIAPDECLWCSCCHSEAPQNIDWRKASPEDNSSRFKKQPETEEELNAVVRAAANCMVECIYYGGTDPRIIELMLADGVKPNCNLRVER